MFDSFVIEKVCNELNTRIKGRRLQRIDQLARDRFVLQFGSRDFLKLDLSPQSYHISMIEQRMIDQSPHTGFYTGLRKHLYGARLIEARQHQFDRTVELRFHNLNVVMEPIELSLYLEMMGRHANAILVDADNIILQALKYSDHYDRPIIMGEAYELFPARKLDPFEADVAFEEALNYKGFTRALLKLLPQPLKALSVSEVSQWIMQSNQPCVYYADEQVRDYHCFKNDELALVESESLFAAINRYYSELPDQSKTSKMANYRQKLTQRLKQIEVKLAHLEQDARNFARSEEYKQQADIIYANLYQIQAGDSRFEGFDFEGQPISITLDPALSPVQNAQRRYERYQKMTRGQKAVARQLRLAALEMDSTRQLLYDLENINSNDELTEFEKLLYDQGLIKRHSKSKSSPASKPIEQTYRDVLYTIGRNSNQNERLIARKAHRNWVWFHAQGIPGSHVIMHCRLQDADADLIEHGAKLAATYSQAGPGVKVTVDYLPVSNLRKPRGAAPGYVTFRGQDSIVVIGDPK